MAGPLLLLLLSLALGSAGQAVQDNGERIINGVVCPRGSHPWQVALYHKNEFHCAGVLLNQRWVLTVAHCRLSEYIVQMGSDLLDDGKAHKFRATESFLHPWYTNRTYRHDIMLVKLSSPAKLSPNVKTINLPSSCKDPGTSCTVSGWGITTMEEGLDTDAFQPRLKTTPDQTRPTAASLAATNTSELMCSNVKLVSHQDCKKIYPTFLKNYMVCAAPPDRLSYCCKGDSGSPLICEGSLQGLVSSGYYPCTPPFRPVIYTRLCMYCKWIDDIMKTNS